LLGEAAGNILPIVAAAKGPQIAEGLLNHADAYRKYHGATTAPGAPATVWHGSPHRFDKFDSSKIGTGEGAQAYGHGLYLAENPLVAKDYRTLGQARDAMQIGGRSYDDFLDMSREVVQSTTKDRALLSKAVTRAKSLEEAAANLAALKKAEPARDFSKVDALLDLAKRQGISFSDAGHLYKVDLPDSAIARMLDWDKPLSQQPEAVRKAVDALKRGPLDSDTARILSDAGDNMNAGTLYNYLGMDDRIGTRAAAAAALRQQGVPGIRYLDGGSRGAGAGSSNFVVFPGEEGLLSILGRE
jgi:hypothetical protein